MRNVYALLVIFGLTVVFATQTFAGREEAKQYADVIGTAAISDYSSIYYCIPRGKDLDDKIKKFIDCFRGTVVLEGNETPKHLFDFMTGVLQGKGLFARCGSIQTGYFKGPDIIEQNLFYKILFTGSVPYAYKVTGYCPKSEQVAQLLEEESKDRVDPEQLKNEEWVNADGSEHDYGYFIDFAESATKFAQDKCEFEIVTIYQLDDTPLF